MHDGAGPSVIALTEWRIGVSGARRHGTTVCPASLLDDASRWILRAAEQSAAAHVRGGDHGVRSTSARSPVGSANQAITRGITDPIHPGASGDRLRIALALPAAAGQATPDPWSSLHAQLIAFDAGLSPGDFTDSKTAPDRRAGELPPTVRQPRLTKQAGPRTRSSDQHDQLTRGARHPVIDGTACNKAAQNACSPRSIRLRCRCDCVIVCDLVS